MNNKKKFLKALKVQRNLVKSFEKYSNKVKRKVKINDSENDVELSESLV